MLVVIIWSLVGFTKHSNQQIGHINLERSIRYSYLEDTIRQMSFAFLGLFVLMVASTAFLVYALTKGKKRITDIPAVYESEAIHLTWILVFFLFTYGARFCSDLWVIPYLTRSGNLDKCLINGMTTFCVNSVFIIYYMWTALFFDLAPIGVIVYFHHRSFRLQAQLRVGSVLTNNSSKEAD